MPSADLLPGLAPTRSDDSLRYVPDQPEPTGFGALVGRVRGSDRRTLVSGGVLLVIIGLGLAAFGLTRGGDPEGVAGRSDRVAAVVSTTAAPATQLPSTTTSAPKLSSRDSCRAAFKRAELVLDQTIPFTECNRDDFVAVSFEEAQSLSPGYNRSWWGAYTMAQSCAELAQRKISPLTACVGVE